MRSELKRTGGAIAKPRKRAANTGKAFQEFIKTREGLHVKFLPIPNGVQILGPGKFFPIKTPFDFAGAFVGSGRGLFFDAKAVAATDRHSGFRGHDPAILKPHQAEALHVLALAGSAAGLLVECGRRGEILWVNALNLYPLRMMPWDVHCWVVLGKIGGAIDWSILK